MYDFGPTQAHWDSLWADIRDQLHAGGIAAPNSLTRSDDPWQDWRNPNLLLSQTCGLPFRAELHNSLTLVGAPAWATPDQPAMRPGQYYSVVLVRAEDPRTTLSQFRGAALALNDPLSQSGWGLMHRLCISESVQFKNHIETGSHMASARAVRDGRADLASVDAVTWAHLQRVAPWCSDLAVLTRTPGSPALPFVTAKPDLAAALLQVLKSTLARAAPEVRGELFFAPVPVVPASYEDYMAIEVPPAPA